MKETQNKLIEKLKSTKEALKLTEKKFQFLFDYSSDEIFLSDLTGKFIEVNKVACESLDYTKEEMLKMTFTNIKTSKYRQLVSENIKKIEELGKYTYESEHVTKDGIVFPVEMKSRIIDFNNEKAIISVARNISERKKFEKKLLSTIIATEEKERKRFANDLHDGLSPILTTIKLYTDLLDSEDIKHTSRKDLIKNINELVDTAVSTAKEIAKNITPSILHDFGLATAIEEFCKYINETKSLNITVKTKDYKNIHRSIEETVLYQTTKELINNTLKHASAENITIELKSSDTQIILYFRDDGIGFDINNKLKTSTGLGLNNIVNKIKTIKGTCDFYCPKDGGMMIIIVVKLDNP